MTRRLLLCRPQGGLNDMFCQIAAACAYAERYGRTVIVDTNHATIDSFRDELSCYFESRWPSLLLDVGAMPPGVNDLDVVPRCLTGRIHAYEVRYDTRLWKWVEADTGDLISFDFARDYDETVLVHQSAGGGQRAIEALGRLRLQAHLRHELQRRLEAIRRPFVGVHVRSSDYQTDYVAAARSLALLNSDSSIFVATDSRGVADHFTEALGAERVVSFATLPDLDASQPLHYWRGPPGRRLLNEDAILDLLMLALADAFHMFELQPNIHHTKFSGYSLLVANLRGRPDILSSLIG